jgi:hypothetical protein
LSTAQAEEESGGKLRFLYQGRMQVVTGWAVSWLAVVRWHPRKKGGCEGIGEKKQERMVLIGLYKAERE